MRPANKETATSMKIASLDRNTDSRTGHWRLSDSLVAGVLPIVQRHASAGQETAEGLATKRRSRCRSDS
jgi:hypothetical protein